MLHLLNVIRVQDLLLHGMHTNALQTKGHFCEIHPIMIHHIKTLTHALSSNTTKFYYFRQYTPNISVVILKSGDGQHDRNM
jgi:hypothetical protein